MGIQRKKNERQRTSIFFWHYT